ncbi:hypothetical protein [Spirillospora albida]|uniref:hypothetical protein n=1 Tax=Spirillospora albida TaxID=58123 RepID=UPI0012F8D1C3|nr:hypothetical protein [Spirillospora albida]
MVLTIAAAVGGVIDRATGGRTSGLIMINAYKTRCIGTPPPAARANSQPYLQQQGFGHSQN